MEVIDRALTYRDPVLHFYALRLVVLRERGRIEETPQQRSGGKFPYAHLRTYTQPTQLLAAGAKLAAHPQPALRTGLMAPVGVLLYVFGD